MVPFRTFVVFDASKILPRQDCRSHLLARYPKSEYRKLPTSNFALHGVSIQPRFLKGDGEVCTDLIRLPFALRFGALFGPF